MRLAQVLELRAVDNAPFPPITAERVAERIEETALRKGRDRAKADRIRKRRRVRFAKIGRRAPRRDSFRVYWREEGTAYPPFKGNNRRVRRLAALRDWRARKQQDGAP